MHLVVGAEQWVPWLRITQHELTGDLTYSGIMYNLLLALSQTMNFTYELRRPGDGLWGVGFPNGSWSGMLGMVKNGEVDFALGPFAFNWERYHYACEFSQPIFMDYESVFMRRAGLETDLFAFSRPFQWQVMLVWLGLLAAAILTWIVLYFFFYLSPYERQTPMKEYNKDNEESQAKRETRMERTHYQSQTMWFIGTLFNQSKSWLPKSDSRRVITAAWLFSCFIFISVFSSTLTAMLSVPKVGVPIDSTDDLVSQTRVPWAIESGSFLFQILYQATEGIYQALWAGHSHMITDCYTSRNDIRAGKFAAVCDKMTMKKVMSEDFSATGMCNFYMAREDFKSMPMALAFQHQHPLYSKANQKILEFVNKGLVERWIAEQLPNSTACLGAPDSNYVSDKRPLTLKDYYGLFTVCAVCEFLQNAS
ncbi:glutamate receptor ionotropic, kainate 5-like [Cherax quadricarinatus]|uniref:glutamate receptor ionotropic, kainate 5-like n=1 Tax=Cherax quadricarinatus TaxID=27406 RepID=UPI00387E8433